MASATASAPPSKEEICSKMEQQFAILEPHIDALLDFAREWFGAPDFAVKSDDITDVSFSEMHQDAFLSAYESTPEIIQLRIEVFKRTFHSPVHRLWELNRELRALLEKSQYDSDWIDEFYHPTMWTATINNNLVNNLCDLIKQHAFNKAYDEAIVGPHPCTDKCALGELKEMLDYECQRFHDYMCERSWSSSGIYDSSTLDQMRSQGYWMGYKVFLAGKIATLEEEERRVAVRHALIVDDVEGEAIVPKDI